MTNGETFIPPAHSFAWDVVQALRDLGGSGKIDEITEAVVKVRGLTEEQQSVPREGGRTELEYRLAWARTLAKALKLIENSAHGVWALTPLGYEVTEDQVKALKKQRAKDRAAAKKAKKVAAEDEGSDDETSDDLDEAIAEDEIDWKSHLLDVLKTMDPYAFERLAKRLLREAGFVNVNVTGGSGDGGIDGAGVYRMSLISFPVYFQCKRYQGTVGSSKVRDFRGAMVGRGDKGLMITTGTFTADAKTEATRDGAPPIDLIDGDQLADLLRQYGLGVTSTARTIYEVTVNKDFFDKL